MRVAPSRNVSLNCTAAGGSRGAPNSSVPEPGRRVGIVPFIFLITRAARRSSHRSAIAGSTPYSNAL